MIILKLRMYNFEKYIITNHCIASMGMLIKFLD